MSTIVLRSVKNSPLTNTEVDNNFSNLNTDKIQIGGTYSSGTASGVLFLNGSKVLTTGSALTFDGTTLTLAGLSNTGNTTLGNATSDTLTVNSTITSNLIFTDNTYDIGASGATRPRNFYLAGAGNIGGNLLVKTSTARANITTDADLVTQNGLGILSTSTTYGQGYQYIRFFNSAAAYAGSISQTASTEIGLYSAGTLTLGASSTAVAYLRSTGLEIGGTFNQGRALSVDSSSNGYTMSLLQTGAYNSGNSSGIVFAGYYDGSSITDFSSIRGGKENATSGNYGGFVSFWTRPNGGSDTEGGRFDSTGNLLLGVTSGALGKLHVVNGTNNQAAYMASGSGTTQQAILTLTNSTNAGYISVAGVGSSSAVSTWTNGSMVIEAVPYSSGNFILDSYTGALVFQTARVEAGRFTSGRDLLINRTSRQNNGKLEVLADSGSQAIVAQVQSNGNSLFQGFGSAGGNAVFQVTGSGNGYFSNTVMVGAGPNNGQTYELGVYRASSDVQLLINSDNGYNAYINFAGFSGGLSYGRDGGTGYFRWNNAVNLGGTQIMTLTDGGNLSLGTTSTTFLLNLSGSTGSRTGGVSHNGVFRHAYNGSKPASTQVKLRVWLGNYTSGMLTFNYAHTNGGDYGNFIQVWLNNSYGQMYTQVVASKLAADWGTITTTTYNPGSGGDGYYEITMPTGNSSGGAYSAVIDAVCTSDNSAYFSVV